MIQKTVVFLFLSLLISSCKTAQIASNTNAKASDKTKVEQIVKGHNDNFKDFSTLNIKADVDYEDQKNKQSVNADIRIKKDEIIWINISVLGFSVAKASITPTKVSYYEKINKTYFEGDFALISNWLGTDLDFQKVQNLLLGKALDEISKENFVSQVVNNLYQLSEKKPQDIQKQYIFEAGNFLLKKEIINQVSENRNLEIDYLSHAIVENNFFPKEISIKANQENEVSIAIEYKRFELDKEAPFPFSIPSGYEKVEIKK